MRYNFNLAETGEDDRRSHRTPSTPIDDLEWLPLQRHPIFAAASSSFAAGEAGGGGGGGGGGGETASAPRAPRNLLAWDGASRLYFWDSYKHCIHRITIRLGEPDPTSVLAASPSKVVVADAELNVAINKVSVNRNGSLLLLAASDVLHVVFLYGRPSSKDDATICRTVLIGSSIYADNDNAIRILQVSWHPYSDTHLGILSSDSVFRVFDLSSNFEQPEQEFYLQPAELGRYRSAASICPVDFSFGGDHLWDRFSVFLLFSDGSVYILCPVVPFGSVFGFDSILEIYTDAQTFGLNSASTRAVSNSSLAISWLEATFPGLAQRGIEGKNITVLKAHPYAMFDASLLLQGPLRKVCNRENTDLEVQGTEFEGRAVSFLYNAVCKDSILVIAWSGGQLQIDALADEIQPVWNVGCPPRVCVDSHDRILGVAMICESNPTELSLLKLDQPADQTAWLGYSPPLLRLALVDLALPRIVERNSYISVYADPLIPERIYALHDGGVDSVLLHFLPFTSQANDKNEAMRTPSVNPVLSTCQGEISSPSPLSGFVGISDSFGYSWIVGITAFQECVVLDMKSWNALVTVHVDMERKPINFEELAEVDTRNIISKELLTGPKTVVIPSASQNLRSVAADSIEGRSTLHQYFKLFHEIYVEYAHKVYFELKYHDSHLKRIIDDQHARLREAQQKLLKVEEKQKGLEDRIDHAVQRHDLLNERLQRLRKLPAAHKKPLSRAERKFKSELDNLIGVELDAMCSSIEALNARTRRYTQSIQGNVPDQPRQSARIKNCSQEAQISQLRSSIAKLSLVNSENSKKVKLVESELSCWERNT